MRYRMVLKKERKHFWDEDGIGSCHFNASSDEFALAFAFTIAERMNRVDIRAKHPRGFSVSRIERLEENGYGDKVIPLDIGDKTLLKGFCEIRRALEVFYPKQQNGRGCMMHMFTDWKPFAHPRSRVA